MPETADAEEWRLQMIPQYTECAVNSNLCYKALIEQHK